MQSSWWPTILRTDSATTINVSRRVTLLTWLSTLGYVILGIAGVVTPLGLSDSIRPDGTVQTEFRYVQDQSPFGYGTPPRYTNFSRFCGDLLPVNCPGRSDGYKNPEVFPNGTYCSHICKPGLANMMWWILMLLSARHDKCRPHRQ